jgi:energy-coupling factor transporter transmembrane protein EcfT
MCWPRAVLVACRPVTVGHHRQCQQHDIDLGDFREVLGQYILITFVIFIGLMLAGVSGPYSAMLSMIVIATGGFFPLKARLKTMPDLWPQLVLTIGLMLGTISVFWRRRCCGRQHSFSPQIRR